LPDGGCRLSRRDLTFDQKEVRAMAAVLQTGQIIALDEALRRLESQRPSVAQVVHLRFYAGLCVVLAVLATWRPL
jgi:hypothetical protein